ncbi:AraC family transcriptional regulator N-terminal domain-containing protein [Microcoleus sp. S28C3]|uniref:AraC family transcriptional regulator N-terminal domain-containing protein n=1 Tax=Microcoleus sp. S28C3 TaxID=3055414 RepID=UPI002FD2980F
MHFNRSSSPSECVDSVSILAFFVIAEGSKEALLGSAIALQYDPMYYLLATIELT